MTPDRPTGDPRLSIPSRRVGDCASLHCPCCCRLLSIPSRRVGDCPRSNEATDGVAFPSPQGGSETVLSVAANLFATLVSIPSRRVGDSPRLSPRHATPRQFPSPQGGSETIGAIDVDGYLVTVSIPSRRVGDLQVLEAVKNSEECFHPLKAGRRLGDQDIRHHAILVSIPSRRVGDEIRGGVSV